MDDFGIEFDFKERWVIMIFKGKKVGMENKFENLKSNQTSPKKSSTNLARTQYGPSPNSSNFFLGWVQALKF